MAWHLWTHGGRRAGTCHDRRVPMTVNQTGRTMDNGSCSRLIAPRRPTIWQVFVATGDVIQLSRRDGWMPCFSPNNEDVLFVSLDNRTGAIPPPGSPGLYAVDAQGQERLVFLAGKDVPLPFAPACGRNNAELAYASIDGLHVGGQPVSKKEDVFPSRPQWLNRNDLLYTADGHIKRRSMLGDTATEIPFRANVTLQRSPTPWRVAC